MTESSAIFKKTINKQINDFFCFRKIHLRYRNRKSQKNIFSHRFFSIHLLRIDMIRFHRKTRFQAKKKKTIKFLTNIQTRAAQIIAEAFKFISETALKIKFYLFLIRQQFDVFIYDALLRIIINFIYEHIRSQRKLSDRAWIFEAI